MTMSPGVRKLVLTAHVVSSLGWLGAVAAFFALSVAGLTSRSGVVVRAAYVSMDVITWSVIIPACIAALATGLVQSLGTPWGLFRHYWVVFKLVLTVAATLILFLHTSPIGDLAAKAHTIASAADLHRGRVQLVVVSGLAVLVLLVTTVLGVYKPRGMTAYGRRKQG